MRPPRSVAVTVSHFPFTGLITNVTRISVRSGIDWPVSLYVAEDKE